MDWKAVLIDAPTQSGKTRKTFEIISQKLIESDDNKNVVLFITQANSLCSANQILQRAKNQIKPEIIKHENIYKSGNLPEDAMNDKNIMIIDFWNSRNMTNMYDFIRGCEYKKAIIVYDEFDQGGYKGVQDRLTFVRKVEKLISNIKLIFVTATVGNLSKSVCQIAGDNLINFKHSKVISDLIHKPVVEHQYVQPFETYVGPSWFKETSDVWRNIIFEKKKIDQEKDSYENYKEDIILSSLRDLPQENKELTLIVVSARINNHENMVEKLFRIGYNVTVELNGRNSKNYRVKYVNNSGTIKSWNIPYLNIDNKADNGDLKMFRYNRKLIKTYIEQKEDYTLPHILQAVLFMNTDKEDRIRDNTSDYEFIKLKTLANAFDNMKIHENRPYDYPENPTVALIAGNLASRGVTFQDPAINFICSAFCFTDTNDTNQRGAVNSQRFGRACGMLSNAYSSDTGRKPILLATEKILCGAISNELILREKALLIENGTLFSLKDMITKEDWINIVKKAEKKIKIGETKNNAASKISLIDGVSIDKLKYYISCDTLIGKMIRYLYKNTKDGSTISHEEFRSGINYEKTMDSFINNIDCGRGERCKYGKLWKVVGSTITINQNIIKYC